MSSTFGRARSTEAPMVGIEFTNRANTVPAWRREAGESSTPMKRTYSIANPPPSPFDPKRGSDAKPVFGDNVKYLFKPQIPTTQSQSSWGWNAPSTPVSRAPDTPEVDMNDVELTPPAPTLAAKEKSLRVTEGDDNESPDARPMSNSAVRRVERARRRTKGKSWYTRRRPRYGEEGESGDSGESGDDDDGEERALAPVTQKTSNHYTLNMPGPAAPKSDTPYLLLGYLQFLFNLSLILVFLYLLLQFILTVQRDVEQRISEHSMEILQDITTCTTLYKTNLCDTSPIPAMMHQCAAWETCMTRDPRIVGRAKVSAEMLAEVVNGFVEPISWKTLAFTLSSLSFLTVFVNALLSLYRSRHHPALKEDAQSHHRQPSHLQLQQQPHFAPMSPFHPHQYAYLPPPAWRPEGEVEQMPSRRRRLENGDAAEVR